MLNETTPENPFPRNDSDRSEVPTINGELGLGTKARSARKRLIDIPIFYALVFILGLAFILFPIILLQVEPLSETVHYLVKVWYCILLLFTGFFYSKWQRYKKKHLKFCRYIERNKHKLSSDPHILIAELLKQIDQEAEAN